MSAAVKLENSEFITWQTSRSGHRVPVIDGYASHSLVDPIREAQRWAKEVSERLKVPVRRLYILGGGAGFQIEALLTEDISQATAIFLIEKNQDCYNHLRIKFAEAIQTKRLQLSNEMSADPSSVDSTLVIMFAGAAQSSGEFYFECRKKILAQTELSWKQGAQARMGLTVDLHVFKEAQDKNRHPLHMLIQEQAAHDAISAALVELFT